MWSVTFSKEHRLSVLGNELLGRVYAPKRNEVTEGLRKLHEELYNFSMPNNVRITGLRTVRLAEHIECMEMSSV
jgi:hypothetical protein